MMVIVIEIIKIVYKNKICVPDSEWELWVELTVEVEHSDTDLLL